MDRLNRVLWTLIALVLMATGVLGVAAGRGYIRGIDPRSTLLPRPLLEQWRAWGIWAWLALAAAGLVLSWLGWRLLRASLRPGGPRALPTELILKSHDGRETAGTIRLHSPALAHATEHALARHLAAERARVGLFGDLHRPELRVRIDASPDTDLPAMAEGLPRVLEELTATSGLRPDPVRVTVRPGSATGPRVH
jgi:hypothetical protein